MFFFFFCTQLLTFGCILGGKVRAKVCGVLKLMRTSRLGTKSAGLKQSGLTLLLLLLLGIHFTIDSFFSTQAHSLHTLM